MAAAIEQDPTPTDAPRPVNATDATRPVKALFRYSGWVHIGGGAADCEHAMDGACADDSHFHAWCRLPNQFQHTDIRERALAAKARRKRQLRDPHTDAYEVVEGEIDELRSAPREELVQEIVARDWWKRHLEALRDVDERDEYEHIERDRERFRELQALPEDERPSDELEELERHLTKHADEVEARRRVIEQPAREAAEGMETDELLTQIREDRVMSEANAAFMDVYMRWQIIAGTFTSQLGRTQRFTNVEELGAQAPEVADELRRVFTELEGSFQRGDRGN